jgi:transposase
VLQVHGIDAAGKVVLRRRLRRAQAAEFFAALPPCLVGVEACGTAHHSARVIRSLGHEVRLMPPQYVTAYVRRGKNDAADAAAICEAVTRPSMRFVPVKTEEQQAALVMHRARPAGPAAHPARQRDPGTLAEFGIVEAQGIWKVGRLRAHLAEAAAVREVLLLLAGQFDEVERRIYEIDARILAWHKASPVSRRLATIPGIGPLIATAIAATVPDAGAFRSGREFAAWLGLVPRQRSSGGKQRLGRISREGDRYVRRLLVVGAQSALIGSKELRASPWVQGLLARCARLKVALAVANKTARIAWAVMTRDEPYRRAVVPA